MANITKRGNSYSIRVSAGYDASGKQIMKSMTWKIPEGMSEKKAENPLPKIGSRKKTRLSSSPPNRRKR